MAPLVSAMAAISVLVHQLAVAEVLLPPQHQLASQLALRVSSLILDAL